MPRNPAKTKQKPAKRRPRPATRKPTPDDELFEIRDIIDEKREEGKLLYKVDWADNPRTGERYTPTWEPAKNVTEAAVADWERAKLRRQGLESASSSRQTDSQPVPPPNWRAKRRRESSVAEEDERSSKRLRRSVDSGYTSTQSNDGRSQSLVPSLPEKRAQSVFEVAIEKPPGLDPSDYRLIPPSQSASSSQNISQSVPSTQEPSQFLPSSQGGPLDVTTFQDISDRTIQDSQEDFEALRTQSTAQSAANPAEPDLAEDVSQLAAEDPTGVAEGVSQPAGGEISQAAAQPSHSDSDIPIHQPQGSHPDSTGLPVEVSQPSAKENSETTNLESQPSHSDPDIPSRQPEGSHQDSRHSSGLLEAHDLAQGSVRDSVSRASTPEHLQGGQTSPSDEDIWSGGFLTQPEQDIPLFTEEVESQSQGGRPTDQSLNQEDHPHITGSPRSGLFSSATDSHPQAAQKVSLLESNSGPFLTQDIEAFGKDEEIVPDTVQREPIIGTGQNTTNSQRGLGEVTSVGQFAGASRPSTPANRTTTPLPFTPQNFMMNPDGTPRSAVEVMRQLQASVFGSSPALPERDARLEAPLLSPSLVLPGMGAQGLEGGAAPAEHPVSAVEELNRCIGMGINVPGAAVGGHNEHTEHEQPQTVAPSDLTTFVDHIPGPDDGPSADEQILGGGEDADIVPTTTHDDSNQFSDQEEESMHFLVTLPMAANSRSIYLDTITDNKATMIEFGNVFADSDMSEPDVPLVAKMDSIFGRLLELCDLPAYDESPLQLRSEEMMKHATNSNSKFSFVYEFLSGLWDINARVLILSQPGRVFEYLEAVVSAAGFNYTLLGQESSTGKTAEGPSVTLAVAGQDLSQIQAGIEVVLLFDHAARSVELPASLGYESTSPMVLSLVVTYSLEHLDQQLLQLEPDLDGLERKNALNLAVAAAKDSLRNPRRGVPEPHAVAEIFANFMKNPDSGLDWEPHPVPEGIFDMWMSQAQGTQNDQIQLETDVATGLGGRKRPNDNVDEGTPKRPRLLLDAYPVRNATPARMSELLKRTLAGHPIESGTATPVEVPVEKLERMADKISELEARLASQSAIEAKLRDHVTSIESQLRSNERTVQDIQPKYAAALNDRSAFEKEAKAAVEKANTVTERLEAQKSENELLKSKLADATAAMANSSNPDLVKLAQTAKERDDALATIENLEKKIRVAQNDLDYSRKAYQDASNAHTELNREHQDLKTKAAEFERRASENLLKIHQIHAQNELASFNREIDDLKATVENRERELDRAMQELRLLKNGRRETRGSSVPRSPRTASVMSPRMGGRGVGGGGAGSRGTSPAPGMSSDGATPVPGMTYFPPVANAGRWGHLRD